MAKEVKRTVEEWTFFRANLRRLMKEASLTGKEMAELIGVSSNYISKILCGHSTPGISTQERIADCFGVSANSLFFEEDRARVAKWKAFGNSVRAARESRGWTCEYTAHLLKLDPVDYRIIEKGDRNITGSMKKRVCDLFDLNQHGKAEPATQAEEVKKVPKKRTTIAQVVVTQPAKQANKAVSVAEDLSNEIIDMIIKHVTDLKVSKDSQIKVYRAFSKLRMRREELEIFG